MGGKIKKNNKMNRFFKFVKLKYRYIGKLKKIVSHLELLKEEIHQGLYLLMSNHFFTRQNANFLILYTILFHFLPSNSVLQVSNANGISKIFCTAGLLDLTGKQKISKKLVLIRFFKFLSKLAFLKNKPIALHLRNVKLQKHFVKKLKSKFMIRIIKTFHLKPFNGCRQKKKKRKR